MKRLKENKLLRWVIKLGSSIVTDGGKGVDTKLITHYAKQISFLQSIGYQIILVSSGSIVEGIRRLKWDVRPKQISQLQAAAAVGQVGMIRVFEEAFQKNEGSIAQILLTHEDFSDRKRYLNSKSTMLTLLKNNVTIIINENDTVSTNEIKVGDNDTLAALVANQLEADLLVILTDQSGIFEENPDINPNAKLIKNLKVSDKKLLKVSSGSTSRLGVGGMITKVKAAKIAAAGGANTVITDGFEQNVLFRLADGESLGTLIKADIPQLRARKQWLSNQLKIKGRFILDEGAESAIFVSGKSLLPIGVVGVEGDFDRGDAVACVNASNDLIAIGLSNYSSADSKKIIGNSSSKIESIIGFVEEPELIHRDNLSLTDFNSSFEKI